MLNDQENFMMTQDKERKLSNKRRQRGEDKEEDKDMNEEEK